MKYSKQSIITTQRNFLIKTLNDQKKITKATSFTISSRGI